MGIKMEKSTISATEVARSFSDILNKVRYQGACFDIKRGNEIVATLSPSSEKPSIKVEELNALLNNIAVFSTEEQEAFLSDIETAKSGKGENKWD